MMESQNVRSNGTLGKSDPTLISEANNKGHRDVAWLLAQGAPDKGKVTV